MAEPGLWQRKLEGAAVADDVGGSLVRITSSSAIAAEAGSGSSCGCSGCGGCCCWAATRSSRRRAASDSAVALRSQGGVPTVGLRRGGICSSVHAARKSYRKNLHAAFPRPAADVCAAYCRRPPPPTCAVPPHVRLLGPGTTIESAFEQGQMHKPSRLQDVRMCASPARSDAARAAGAAGAACQPLARCSIVLGS
eukprot:COSAG06_NODE_3025_length_5945_cov_88.882826_2_plen_195_part_00